MKKSLLLVFTIFVANLNAMQPFKRALPVLLRNGVKFTPRQLACISRHNNGLNITKLSQLTPIANQYTGVSFMHSQSGFKQIAFEQNQKLIFRQAALLLDNPDFQKLLNSDDFKKLLENDDFKNFSTKTTELLEQQQLSQVLSSDQFTKFLQKDAFKEFLMGDDVRVFLESDTLQEILSNPHCVHNQIYLNKTILPLFENREVQQALLKNEDFLKLIKSSKSKRFDTTRTNQSSNCIKYSDIITFFMGYTFGPILYYILLFGVHR
jgi:hypothetical protein